MPPICTHGMPSPASCVDCMMDGPVGPLVEEHVREQTSVWTTAKYDGRCAGCGQPVDAGDRIGMLDVGWVGTCCAVDVA